MHPHGLLAASLVLLNMLGPLACEPPPLEHLEPAFPVPNLWPPNREVVPLGERTLIDPTSVKMLEPIQLVEGPPLQLKRRSLGKPTVLLPRQEGTYYPAKHVLTNRRAMVHRVAEDKHGIVRGVHEAYLVDFEDGVVERFASMNRFEQYSEAGVGIAWQMRGGVKWKVLVHGEDGLVIPLWPETDTAPNLLIHPVWKQAWIFGVEVGTRGYGKFPDKEEVRSVYIHWPDLRQPPPKGPKVRLPFRARFSRDEIITESASVHGPDHKQQVDVPFVISGDHTGCTAVELNKDGSFDCRYGGYKTLADGWTYGTYSDEKMDIYFEARHRETGESYLIRAGAEDEDCRVTHTLLSPPRLLLSCGGGSPVLLWSPEKVVGVPKIENADSAIRSDNGRVFVGYKREEHRGETIWKSRSWFDLATGRVSLAPAGSEHEHAGTPYGGEWLFAQDAPSSTLLVARLGGRVQRSVSLGEPPGSAAFQAWHSDALLIGYWRGGPNPAPLTGLDPGLGLVVKLPGADNRESLISSTHVLSTRRSQRELIAWPRGSIWAPSSDE